MLAVGYRDRVWCRRDLGFEPMDQALVTWLDSRAVTSDSAAPRVLRDAGVANVRRAFGVATAAATSTRQCSSNCSIVVALNRSVL